jgi:type I restriction enzyme S subunit
VKPYPSYKPSGVAWLGSVPSHWQVEKIKHLVERLIGGATPNTSDESSWDNKNGIPWISIGDMSSSDLVTTTNRKISDKGFREKRMQILPKGTVIYSMYASVGFASITKIEAVTNQAILGLVGIERLDSTFLMSYLNSIRASVLQEATSNTQDNINAEKVRNIPVICPPLDEQEKIAHYLDTETARIDTLIQEKEALIGLLHEAQSSAFASTVLQISITASGQKSERLPWLAKLPTTWRLKKIKHLVLSVDQGISPQCESYPPEEDQWGVLKVGCVNTGQFNRMESKALPADIEPIESITLKKGDVLISRANTKNLVGRAAMADQDYPRLMMSDKHYRLRLDTDACEPQYMVFVLTHPAVRVLIEERATGASASMLNIDRRTIMDLDIPLPPLSIQQQLIREVEKQRNSLSALIAHTQEEITLLKEFRAATIADAVLGRVDVRTTAKP